MENYKHSRVGKREGREEGNLVFFQSHWLFNYIAKRKDNKYNKKKKKSLFNRKYKRILISCLQKLIFSTTLYYILFHICLFSFQSSKFYNQQLQVPFQKGEESENLPLPSRMPIFIFFKSVLKPLLLLSSTLFDLFIYSFKHPLTRNLKSTFYQFSCSKD